MTTLRMFAQVVFGNLGWKLLSLALATLVWIAVHREPVIFSVLAAPVQFRNVPQDLEISSDIVEAVDIETRGPAGILRDLSEKRVAVVLDFASVREPGERTFPIERKDMNLQRGVDLVRIIPSQLRFTFEQRIVRNVPVQPQFSGMLPSGLHIVSAVTYPPQLAITGPESKVRRVTLLHTDPVDLNAISGNKNMRVTAFVPNAQLRIQGTPEVTVKVTVTK